MTIFYVCPISWTSWLGYIIDLKSFVFLATGAKSRLPLFILEKATRFEFPTVFHEKYPFPGFVQD